MLSLKKHEKQHTYLREMYIGLWQCLGLLMQRVDEGAMAMDLLLYLPLLSS